MIQYAVKKIRKLDDIRDDLVKSGVQHVKYGVKEEYYPHVAAALLWTLETYFQQSNFYERSHLLTIF